MAYVKKDPAYVSEMRAKAGRISGAVRREKWSKPGSGLKGRKLPHDLKSPALTTISLRSMDRNVFVAFAKENGITVVRFMHELAEKLRKTHPEYFGDGNKSSPVETLN